MNKNFINRSTQRKKIIVYSVLGFTGLLMTVVLASMFFNLFLPSVPENPQQLSAETAIHASETLNLMDELGPEIWPGFHGNFPLIIWNNATAFLINQSEPLEDWEQIEGLIINELPVYRQANEKPYQAFTETLSNSRYAGSMATKNTMNLELMELFRHNLPSLVKHIFPYRLLMLSTDFYITSLAHETFHAYQAETYPERFTDAEEAYPKRSAYEGLFENMSTAWTAEIHCLQDAVAEDNPAAQKALVQEFLLMRANRRDESGLTPNLVLYEKRLEWLEGSAKYVELEMWRNASSGPYQPFNTALNTKDFDSYQGYAKRWKTELKNMDRAAENGGETLFYYSGMLQARLLDELMPDWKSRMGEPNTWLENMLREAISQTASGLRKKYKGCPSTHDRTAFCVLTN